MKIPSLDPSDPDVQWLLRVYDVSDTVINDELDRLVEYVRGLLADRQKEFFPFSVAYEEILLPLDIEKPEYKITMMVHLDFDIEKRRKIIFDLGHDLGVQGRLGRMIFVISEAWVSVNVNRPELGSKGAYDMPADDPQRQEAVMVAGLSGNGKEVMAQVQIRRNPRGCMVAGDTYYAYAGKNADNGKVTNELCRYFFAGISRGLSERLGDKQEDETSL